MGERPFNERHQSNSLTWSQHTPEFPMIGKVHRSIQMPKQRKHVVFIHIPNRKTSATNHLEKEHTPNARGSCGKKGARNLNLTMLFRADESRF
jgi:hypothetical protein